MNDLQLLGIKQDSDFPSLFQFPCGTWLNRNETIGRLVRALAYVHESPASKEESAIEEDTKARRA